MPYIKIWLHCVWNTKNRRPVLVKKIREKLFEHIRDYSRSKEIFIDKIGGYNEHVHCLISLGSEQSISKVMNLLKGESSHWLNNSNMLYEKFEWQDDYFAVSVSESILDNVRRYILNQENHHTKISFQEELDNIVKKYNFQILG
jgi:REP element-mobilizing transposase RayT